MEIATNASTVLVEEIVGWTRSLAANVKSVKVVANLYFVLCKESLRRNQNKQTLPSVSF